MGQLWVWNHSKVTTYFISSIDCETLSFLYVGSGSPFSFSEVWTACVSWSWKIFFTMWLFFKVQEILISLLTHFDFLSNIDLIRQQKAKQSYLEKSTAFIPFKKILKHIPTHLRSLTASSICFLLQKKGVNVCLERKCSKQGFVSHEKLFHSEIAVDWFVR